MPHAPRVTIVIPLHNDEPTAAAAIESCLAQTVTDLEVICVDDASTDGTTEIIDRYMARDARVRMIRQERNSSAFQARRLGVLAAAGDHVIFVDGDDELLHDAVEKSLAAADRHGADLVGFAIEVINPEGKVVGGYQNRLAPKHESLVGDEILSGLFPVDQPAQGQLWRYLFRTTLLRDAYARLPEDLVLPRVNDLPLMFLVAATASKYVSIPDRLYRYHYGRGGSGQSVETIEQAKFYAEAIRSIDSVAPAVRGIARRIGDPGPLLDSYESVRLSIIGYVCAYLLKHTTSEIAPAVFDHLYTCAEPADIVVAAVRFYPECLPALKAHSTPVDLDQRRVKSVLLTTRTLTTGGVSGVLLAQADFLKRAGYRVTIVARRYGSDRDAVPDGAHFIEMVGRGLPERLVEWAEICRSNDVDVVIDHQVLYSRDWPEYALMARALGVATIGWIHNFAGRPIYDLNGLHALLKANAPLLEKLVTLSPLDVAFWKLRGVPHAVYVPNPPSPLLLQSAGVPRPKRLGEGRVELIWWGRLDEHTKQVSQLIDVADHLRQLSFDFHLTVVGPDWGDWTASRFNAEVRKRRLDAHIEAVGERRGERLIEAIDRADAFVTTSIIEGYQLTIAEAQSRGLPVFMYELPWLTLVQENDGVVAVAQGDSGALAREIASTFASPDRYTALSEASIVAADRELSHDFGLLYEQVITGTLPSAFSPEPTLADARQLVDLIVFYAEQNAGLRTEVSDLRKRAKSGAKQREHAVEKPVGASLKRRAWRAATPLGRTLLQVFPGLRPLVHRAKLALHRR
ncbi:glycosyltransferase [Microbacterium hominis]|uniref:Glycosyltransferase n=1 Tax=Microbacterium hominis TaxID=162426 RepID=A0A7D4Q3V8_9MICO|nr:glycosyltransferase [Microbacterium hominis]QKJ20351.1 glycosyltransferase [Microbacterium hominis]